MARREVEPKNEIFALHLDGQLLDRRIWAKSSNKWGHNELHGWRPPRYFYAKAAHAKAAIKHLPKFVQEKVTIVRYAPDNRTALVTIAAMRHRPSCPTETRKHPCSDMHLSGPCDCHVGVAQAALDVPNDG